MAGPKFDPPDLRPERGAQGLDLDDPPVLSGTDVGRGAHWSRCGSPGRAGTSNIGSAAKARGGKTRCRPDLGPGRPSSGPNSADRASGLHGRSP